MAVKLFKIVSAFYPGFAREKVKKCFVIVKSLQATEHCVGGNVLPTTNRLSGPAPHYSTAR